MSNHSHRKGAAAEREAAGILSDQLGLDIKRKLGAGRAEDTGDMYGIPNTTVQVANWPSNYLASVRVKCEDAEQQAINAGNDFSFAFIRLRGGLWRAVMTPQQIATYVRETL